MAQKTDIRLRRSNTANAIPTHSNLSDGEMAMNTADGALYFKKSDNTIITAHDNTILHIDSSNNSIGIGTTSPASKLSTVGTIRSEGMTTVTGGAGTEVRYDVSGGYGGILAYDRGNSAYKELRVEGSIIKFKESGTDVMTIDGNKVGIGTTSPGELLELNSDGSDDEGAILLLKHANNNTTDVLSTIKFANNAGSVANIQVGTSGSNSTGYITFNTDITNTSAERMRIHSNGKVGIGTSSPTETLHVMSGVSNDTVAIISGSQSDRGLTISTYASDGRTDGGVDFDAYKSFKFTTDGSERARIDSSGNVGIGATSPTEKLQFNVLSGTTESIFFEDNSSGNYGFKLRYIESSNKFQIQGLESGSQTSMFNINRSDGHVGVGTASPTAHSGTGFVVHATTGGSGNTGSPRIRLTNTTTGQSATDGAELSLDGNTRDFYIENREGQDIIFYSGSERMRIDSSGRLGIGTTAPSSILHISDASSPEIRLEDSDATSTFNITTFQNTAGSLNFNTRQDDGTFVSTDYQIGKNASGANIHKWFIGGSEKARLDGSGNLLIGTTSNSISGSNTTGVVLSANAAAQFSRNGGHSLDINRTQAGELARFRSAGTQVGSIGAVSGDIYIAGLDSNHAALRLAASAKAVLPVTHVGALDDATTDLGQSNARFKDLYLSGVANVGTKVITKTTNGEVLRFERASDSLRYNSITSNSLDSGEAFISFKVHDGVSATSQADVLHLKGDGKVGIGTTTPQQQLTVGTLESSSIMTHGTVGIKTASDNKAINMQENSGAEGWAFGVDASGNLNFYDSASTDPSVQFIDNGGVKFNNAYTFPTADGNAGQVLKTNGSGVLSFADDSGGGGSSTSIVDTDNDTKIQVEESADEDIIRFDTAGSQRMVILANGNVGINNTSPSAKLTVSGSTLFELPSSSNTFKINDSQNSVERFRVTQAGNVGIGTNAPQNTLHVDGTLRVGPYFAVSDRDHFLVTPAGLVTTVSTPNENANYDNSAGNINIRTNSGYNTPVERLTVTSAGNVGVGTTSPSAKLHIVNDSTSVDALYLESTEDSSSAAPILAFKRNSASPADADYLGQLKFKGENDADQDVVYAKITAKILDASDGSEDGLIEFANRKAGSNVITARLRSDSLQLLNGTSLSVAGDATITGNLTVDGTTTTLNTATLDVEDKNITLNYGSGDTSATAGGAGITIQDAVDASTNATILWDGTNDEFDFSHAINSAGTVTAGRFIQTASSGNSFYAASFTRSASGIVTPDIYGSNGTLVLGTSSSTEALGFSSTDATFYGNLTIPNKIIHAGDTDTYLSFANADDFRIVVGNSTRAAFNTSKIHFNQEGINQDFHVQGDNVTDLLYVDASTDRVGIGTSSPDGNLEVVASTTVSGASDSVNNVLIGLQSTNRPTIILDTADTTYTNRTWNITNVGSVGTLRIGRNGLDVMSLKNDGKIGIGTDSPNYSLDINSSTASMRVRKTGNDATVIIESTTAGAWTTYKSPNYYAGALHTIAGVEQWAVGNLAGQSRWQIRRGRSGAEAFSVQTDGKVGINNSAPNARFQVEELGIDTTTTTTSATTQVTLASLNATHFRSARFTIQITNSTDSTYHTTEILAVHDGTTAYITEFGEIHTGSAEEATFDAAITSGFFRLQATPASTDTMVFKVVSYAITV